ncbi:AfsR/SARP family transcriptional regulator [Streptomyces sp. S465]|uniref:AfsR/SARP family transcriptional regulator n=1 Tax=Streptomyces sp. S465 TaxID=2979468 RepID=UPI0022A846CD|nr:BTAD domain-containing putative transcriptional regulator [Streptomyces sp. S465]WAP55145.1 BTAD domain-containing putative transcriptional regulator [Streptomyces sp. S465]
MTEQKRDPVRLNVLGSLECLTDDGTQLPLGGPVHERVLVALLLSPNRVLPVSRLVEAVWDEDPPATASHQVRKAVAALRRRIPAGHELILTDGPGYRAVVAPERLDLSMFTEGLRRAQQEAAEGRTRAAVDTLSTALALWRGPVLAGAGGAVIAAASAALEERHLAATEQYYELRLSLGESGELVGDLRDLIGSHPFQETLRGLLMLALYRSGRQAEALAEFDSVRKMLSVELGIDPSERLTALHEAILRNSPELAAPSRPAPVPPATAAAATPTGHSPPPLSAPLPTPPPPAPTGPHCCTLPYDLPDFTGRDRELRYLLEGSWGPDGQGGPGPRPGRGPRIVAIDGMGGTGKTSLAVRVAHQLADYWPDAHLYVDLRGFTPGEPPLQPGAVAEAMLRTLDVPGERIPEDEAGRLALWRTTAAQHRLVLLLDNAVDSAQVRPLLPGTSDALVLITSRSRLVELDGAQWISLGMMPPQDSTALVARMLGEERMAAEPVAVAELAELCGHLPLALRIAAARLRNRPRWTVRHLVDRLRDETRRLDELRSGERGVTATLTLSYEGLAPAHRTAFRLLGRHPGADVDPYSAGALLGTDPSRAEEVLEHLLDTHLMQQHETGRYAFHDLVRSFAQWLTKQEGQEENTANETADATADATATQRLLDYYLAATEAACDIVFPGRAPLSAGPDGPVLRPAAVVPPLQNIARAREWLDREKDSLLAAVTLADRQGLYRHAAELARNVVFQLDSRGRYEEFRQVAGVAVTASRALEDRSLLALSLSNLAVADWKLGRFPEGLTAAEESLGLSVSLGDRRGEAKSTGMLGLLLATVGRFDEALPHLMQSISLKRELGAPRAEAESLTNLSSLFEHLGRYREAADAARRAVELNQRIGARDNEMVALTDLALALIGLGADEEARACLDRALEMSDDSDSLGDVALVLALSAKVRRRLGMPAGTPDHAERALELERESRAPIRQATVKNILGRLCGHRRDHTTALQLHTDAHRIASAVGYRIEMARALSGMAQACEALGDAAAADDHRRRADALFDQMGVAEAFRRHG